MPMKLAAPRTGQIEWLEYPEPTLPAGHVRVRCRHAAAKHGTEAAFFKGQAQSRGAFDGKMGLHLRNGEPAPIAPFLGNMAVGEVIEVAGDVSSIRVGDRVCYFGGFQETHVVSAKGCRIMPPGMDWRSAVCLDPASFALAAVRDGHSRVGDVAAVFGLGAIGLLVVQLLKLSGASAIFAFDPVVSRRALAIEFGAAVALDPTTCDAGYEIRQATGGRGADVVIEYSGNVHAMQAALRGVAFGGNVVAGSFPPPYPAGLDLGAEAHMNIPNIIFTRACSQPDRDHPRWTEARNMQTCWDMLADGRLSGTRIVQPVVPFKDLKTEYAKVATDPQNYLKLGTEL